VLLKGAYVHNFFLEIWLEYGLILGSIFISILIYYLTRSLFSAKKGILYFLFFSLFFTTGFMKLQFSFSYTLEPTFYMMLALIIKMNTKSSSRIISSKREEKYAKEAI
jgi:O-antigen ligase